MSLMLYMTIFLGASLILVALSRRLGLTSVLGYLVTGLILGQSGFNLIKFSLIQNFIDYASILLVFLIGLELRPQRIWLMRSHLIKLGGIQIVITAGLIVTLGITVLQLPLLNSFIVGFALALSAMILALQLQTQYEQLNTTTGQYTLAVTLAQALVAIFLIALFPLFTRTESSQHGIAYFAATLATISGVFLFGRYLIQPFLNYLAKQNSIELMAATALFTVLAILLTVDALGLHVLIGALLAGMLLADTPFRHAFETMIKPFRSLMSGFFFLSLGLYASFAVITQSPVFIVSLVAALLIIKSIVLAVLGHYSRLNWNNASLLGLGLFQSGELTFLVLYAALKEQLIEQVVMNQLTAVIVLSMLLSPFIYLLAQHIIKQRPEQPRQDDVNTEASPALIIAGFGRFGQIIARVAHQQRLPFTIIDNNQPGAEFIEAYGGRFIEADITDSQTLQQAGIEQAKILVIAIDDVEDCMNAVRYIRLNYPELKLLVRVRDRYHVHLLRDMGIEHFWRETQLSALDMAEYMLHAHGLSLEEAHEQVDAFRQHDLILLKQQQRLNRDDHKIYETHGNALAELKHLFAYNEQVQAKYEESDLNPNVENYRSDVTQGGQN